jgi:lipoate-protein ligase A
MDTWRLIPLETHDAFMNMAVDEAVLTARISERVPNTLRLYTWKPSAVSIGRNQKPAETVYSAALREYGVDLVRRVSGGGTVFHAEDGEVTYSVAAAAASLGRDIPAVYSRIYEAVTDALRLLGIPADFSAGNEKNCPNLTVAGKKISGSSQTVKRGTVLQHGTLLLTVDLPLMFQLLRVKSACTCSQAAEYAERKITSVQKELRHKVTAETAANALAQGFRAMLKINLEPATLTPYEAELAEKLYKSKYATDAWNQTGRTV